MTAEPIDRDGGDGDGGERRAAVDLPAMPFPVEVPFVESVGFTLHRFDSGVAELRLDLDAAHLNSWAVAHGGVQMTMLDVAMAMAARSAEGPDGVAAAFATIEMKTSFLRPAQHRLRAVGRLRHRTPTMAFCEGELFDARGRLCATASGTFKAARRALERPSAAAAPAAADRSHARDAAAPAAADPSPKEGPR